MKTSVPPLPLTVPLGLHPGASSPSPISSRPSQGFPFSLLDLKLAPLLHKSVFVNQSQMPTPSFPNSTPGAFLVIFLSRCQLPPPGTAGAPASPSSGVPGGPWRQPAALLGSRIWAGPCAPSHAQALPARPLSPVSIRADRPDYLLRDTRMLVPTRL